MLSTVTVTSGPGCGCSGAFSSGLTCSISQTSFLRLPPRLIGFVSLRCVHIGQKNLELQLHGVRFRIERVQTNAGDCGIDFKNFGQGAHGLIKPAPIECSSPKDPVGTKKRSTAISTRACGISSAPIARLAWNSHHSPE